MASETKAATSRRKSSAEPKAAVKPSLKTAAKTKTSASKTSAVDVAPKKTTRTKADKPAANKATTRKRKPTGQPITAEARLRHIELAAYYVAERSSFSRTPADCWIAAESEIDGLLLAGKLPA